jgi:hypothetical protein
VIRRLASLAVLLGLAIAGLMAKGVFEGGRPSDEESLRPVASLPSDNEPSGPLVSAPQYVQSPLYLTDARITIEPPEDGFEPVITGERALQLARKEMPGARNATEVTPMFGLFTKRIPGGVSIEHRPAWIVRIQGVCVPAFGPAVVDGHLAEPQPCLSSEWNVVIDATTGKWLLDFSYR